MKNILFIILLYSYGQFVYSADINGYVGGNLGAATTDTGVSGATGTAALDEDDVQDYLQGILQENPITCDCQE